MRIKLETNAKNYRFYLPRFKQYDKGSLLNFRVSPEPFFVNDNLKDSIYSLGVEVLNYVRAVDWLFKNDDYVYNLLSRGKPEIFDRYAEIDYMFIRPDLIMMDSGFIICEIETSPFGLGLSHLLNKTYNDSGFETLVDNNQLKLHFINKLGKEGSIVYTDKTLQYAGQLEYLASEVISNNDTKWSAVDIGRAPTGSQIYRGFYLSEYMNNLSVRNLINSDADKKITPSMTPHVEEKAVMALIWDSRFMDFFKDRLGLSIFTHLREVIPPTCVIGEEDYFSGELPDGIDSLREIYKVSSSKRRYVLKSSGFSNNSSWSEGVYFLHKKSVDSVKTLVEQSRKDKNTLWIIQEFREGAKFPMKYESDSGVRYMDARVRVTPYYSFDDGKLLTIKATGCENTEKIHASSASINTAVASLS